MGVFPAEYDVVGADPRTSSIDCEKVTCPCGVGVSLGPPSTIWYLRYEPERQSYLTRGPRVKYAQQKEKMRFPSKVEALLPPHGFMPDNAAAFLGFGEPPNDRSVTWRPAQRMTCRIIPVRKQADRI